MMHGVAFVDGGVAEPIAERHSRRRPGLGERLNGPYRGKAVDVEPELAGVLDQVQAVGGERVWCWFGRRHGVARGDLFPPILSGSVTYVLWTRGGVRSRAPSAAKAAGGGPDRRMQTLAGVSAR